MKKIVFDIDGVILNVPKKRMEVARDVFGMDLQGNDLCPAVFKEKYRDVYRNLSYVLYRSEDLELYPEVLEIIKKVLESKNDFILLSERRSEEEENALRSSLRNAGIEELVSPEKINIVCRTEEKIPIIREFGGDNLVLVDDGLDKLEKFIEGGVNGDLIWFNEFSWSPEKEIPKKVRVVNTHKEIGEILI